MRPWLHIKRLLVCGVFTLSSCGENGRTAQVVTRETAGNVESRAPQAEEGIDWSEIRSKRQLERLERRDELIARFRGSFQTAGLPKRPTRAITLDPDARFLLCVKVVELLEGEIPDQQGSEVVFAIHSPSIFFFVQGLKSDEKSGLPVGEYDMSIWRRPGSEAVELDVAPVRQ